MKLRIKGDSLRLRLTQGEVRQFDAAGAVEDRVRFAPERALTYRLVRDADATGLAARFERDTIEVRVPERSARDWCGTDLVSLQGEQPLGGDRLKILVEKDFACLTPRPDEDESDNFPHPEGAAKTCAQ